MITPLVQAFEANLIPLNRVRAELGLDPDPQFGNQFYFQLFRKIPAVKTWKIKAVEEDEWEKLFDQEIQYREPIVQSFARGYSQIMDTLRKANLGQKRASDPWDRQTIHKVRQKYRTQMTRLKQDLSKLYANHANDLVEGQVRVALEALELVGVDGTFDADSLQDEFEKMGAKFAEERIVTFRKKINELAEIAERENQNPRYYDDQVRSFINDAKKRSQTVGRSELVSLSTKIKEKVYEANGIKGKQWYTRFSERTCDYCDHLHGMTVAIGTPFLPKGGTLEVRGKDGKTKVMKIDHDDLHGPHLHPNCQCSLIPIADFQDEPIQGDPEEDDNPNESEEVFWAKMDQLYRKLIPEKYEEWLDYGVPVKRPKLTDDRTKPVTSEAVDEIKKMIAQIKGRPNQEQLEEIGNRIQNEIWQRMREDEKRTQIALDYQKAVNASLDSPTSFNQQKEELFELLYQQMSAEVRHEVLSEIRSMGLTNDTPIKKLFQFAGDIPDSYQNQWIETLKYVPTEWLRNIIDKGKPYTIRWKEPEEDKKQFLGAHSLETREIVLDKRAKEDTFLHEFMHATESHHDWLPLTALDYLMRRSIGETCRTFAEMYGDMHPDLRRMYGVQDNLSHPYVGRIYITEKGNLRTTEVLTTSMESLYRPTDKNIEYSRDGMMEMFFLALQASY